MCANVACLHAIATRTGVRIARKWDGEDGTVLKFGAQESTLHLKQYYFWAARDLGYNCMPFRVRRTSLVLCYGSVTRPYNLYGKTTDEQHERTAQ